MKTKKTNNLWRRHLSFALLGGIAVGIGLLTRTAGLGDGFGLGAGTLALILIFFWNRRSPVDRFYGMSAPTTAVASSSFIYELSLTGAGPFFELLSILSLIGIMIALGYLFWVLIPLGGPPKQT